VVRFIENPLVFHQLNISGADISCVLDNDVAEAARSIQPVTLYITLNILPPTVYNSPPGMTADDGSPAEEAPMLGTHSILLPEHPLPPSPHQPIEAGNNKPQSREEVSPASTKDLRLALDQAYQDMKRIDRSNTWQGAVGRIKWVMDTLRPIAEVRVIPF
jgi:hypothetical protein